MMDKKISFGVVHFIVIVMFKGLIVTFIWHLFCTKWTVLYVFEWVDQQVVISSNK